MNFMSLKSLSFRLILNNWLLIMSWLNVSIESFMVPEFIKREERIC